MGPIQLPFWQMGSSQDGSPKSNAVTWPRTGKTRSSNHYRLRRTDHQKTSSARVGSPHSSARKKTHLGQFQTFLIHSKISRSRPSVFTFYFFITEKSKTIHKRDLQKRNWNQKLPPNNWKLREMNSTGGRYI